METMGAGKRGKVIRRSSLKKVVVDTTVQEKHIAFPTDAKLLDRVRKPKSKNKLYSLHAPEVDCISKGKIHKRYEFGARSL